jgi:hypothetical protein
VEAGLLHPSKIAMELDELLKAVKAERDAEQVPAKRAELQDRVNRIRRAIVVGEELCRTNVLGIQHDEMSGLDAEEFRGRAQIRLKESIAEPEGKPTAPVIERREVDRTVELAALAQTRPA